VAGYLIAGPADAEVAPDSAEPGPEVAEPEAAGPAGSLGWLIASAAAAALRRSNGSPYSRTAARAYACWNVATRSERPRPRKLTAQCSTAVTLF
jgi:hypothetical protein